MKPAKYLVIAAFLTGFCLRLYQVGKDSFWNDETGQALAATQGNIQGMLAVIRGHVMAMPLDYLVSAVFSRVSHSEFIMRLPSVIWGTCTIGVFYYIVKILWDDERVSLLTLWILALTPILVQFSQEMRFYASLFFFHAASTLLLLSAFRNPKKSRWLLYIAVTAIGSYFHPYVLLTLVFAGVYWACIYIPATRKMDKIFGWVLASSIVLSLIFLPGYLYFGAAQHFQYGLLEYGGSFSKVLLTGVGWRSWPYSPYLPEVSIWHWVLGIFCFVGLGVALFHWKQNRNLIVFVAGAILQVLIILSADALKGYWFSSRQIIYLAPYGMILSAIGIVALIDWVARSTVFRQSLLYGAILLLAILAFPNLKVYYDQVKSNGRQVVQSLLQVYQPGEPIFVIYGYEDKVYRWYLDQQDNHKDAEQYLISIDWGNLPELASSRAGIAYLIAPAVGLTQDQRDMLKMLGFHEKILGQDKWYGERNLWVRPAN